MSQTPFVFHPYVLGDAVRQFWRYMGDVDLDGASGGGPELREEAAGGFVRKLKQLMAGLGVRRSDIYSARGLTDLPGYYRPGIRWDIAVVTRGRLRAAIDIKTHIGPEWVSAYMRYTNDALARAVDTRAAQRAGAYGSACAPWLGSIMLIEDCPQARDPAPADDLHIPALDAFSGSSYIDRYALFYRRMLADKLYDSVCLLLADRTQAPQPNNYSQPFLDMQPGGFVTSLLQHLSETP